MIDALTEHPKWWPELTPIHIDALRGSVEILVSEKSVAEVCRLNAPSDSSHTPEYAIEKIKKFFNNVYVCRRAADRRESALAAELIRDQNLETCDAIIIATAIIHGAKTLYTRDGLKKRRKNRVTPLSLDGKLGDPPLPIKYHRPPNIWKCRCLLGRTKTLNRQKTMKSNDASQPHTVWSGFNEGPAAADGFAKPITRLAPLPASAAL